MGDKKPTLTTQAMEAYEQAWANLGVRFPMPSDIEIQGNALAMIPALVGEIERQKAHTEQVIQNCIDVLSVDLCEAHTEVVRRQFPGEYLQWSDSIGCRACNAETAVTLRAALAQKEAEAFTCYAVRFKDDPPVAFRATILAVWMQAEKVLGTDVETLIDQGYRLVEGRWEGAVAEAAALIEREGEQYG